VGCWHWERSGKNLVQLQDAEVIRLEKWALLGGAAFSVLSSVAIAVYAKIDPPSRAFPAPLTELAFRGSGLRVDLLPKLCEDEHRWVTIGELRCDKPYFARYLRATNTWEVTGRTRSSDQLVFHPFDNAPALAGNITLWGILAQFDDAGTLSADGTEIGKLEIITGSSKGLR
jgi:hypothetical protein